MNVMQTQPPNQTGKRIQNYVFNYSDFLGKGNFSHCYRGINELTNQTVAIKIVELNSLKSQKLQELLFQEIEILKKLNHPSVLKCYQIFTSNRNCYIITELCNEGDLESKLKKKGTLSQSEANPIIRDIYDGLIYLAENNIVHRDFKSANIFLNNGHAKIADFGFAKEIKHNFKDLNIGSPLYMAPEGILHNIYGPKTQVWALGILVYELFHGRTPYCHCKSQQQLKTSVMMPLNWNQLRPDLCEDIKEFILTCLQVNQQKRPLMQDLKTTAYMRRLHNETNNTLGNSLQFDFRTTQRANSFKPNSLSSQRQDFVPQRAQYNNFIERGREYNRKARMRQTSTDRFVPRQNNFRSVDTRNNFNYDSRISGSPQKQQFPQGVKYQYPLLRSPHKTVNYGNPHIVSDSFKVDSQFFQPSEVLKNGNYNSNQFNPNKNGQMLGFVQQPYSSQQRSPFNSIHHNESSLKPHPIQIVGLNNQIHKKQEGRIGNVITGSLSFKEGICFIHHCRLIFKFLCFYRDSYVFEEQYYVKVAQYLLHLLWQLQQLSSRGDIIATGQKAEIKLQKFDQVNQQYSEKYRKEFYAQGYTNLSNQSSSQTGIRFLLLKVFPNIQMRIQKQISLIGQREILNETEQNLIIMGHLVLVAIKSLNQIEKASGQSNYKSLTKTKHIETVLNTPKQNFTPQTYAQYKKNLHF